MGENEGTRGEKKGMKGGKEAKKGAEGDKKRTKGKWGKIGKGEKGGKLKRRRLVKKDNFLDFIFVLFLSLGLQNFHCVKGEATGLKLGEIKGNLRVFGGVNSRE